MKRVCIFCGSRTGNSDLIIKETNKLLDRLIEADYELVYGGGKSGLMGLIADRFLAAGKKVIGIRPQKLIQAEAAYEGLSEMITVKDMFERKAKMMELSDVFVSLPGGAGTLDELIEIFTHVKLDYINKPCAVLNVEGYYDPLLDFMNRMVQFEFMSKEDLDLLIVGTSGEELASKILS